MEKLNTLIVFLLTLVGLLGILVDLPSTFPGFYSQYSTAIELYLFIFSAFLVLKRIFFYRIRANVEIVPINRKSNHYSTLLIQGVVLTVLYAVYLFIYGRWVGFDTVMIGVLLLYYVGQLLMNSNPSVYVDDQALAFDDFFIEQWKWEEIQNISFEDEKLKVKGKENDFELDFESIDQMDNNKLSWEVDASVLDGTFIEEDSSKHLIDTIKSYANQYGVNHSLN